MGFVDYAGGAVIHITAGFGCVSGVLFLGQRAVKNQDGPFHIGFVALGATLLLFGWFGFNAGGSLAAADTAVIVFTNTGVAAASAMIVWTILYFFEKKQFSFLEMIIGTVAGLATITPCSGYVTPLSATLIGALGAIVCFFAVLIERKYIDDALDVFGCHGMGGFLGTLLVDIFANPEINGISAGLGQFLIQLFGSAIIASYSIVVTYIIFFIADKLGTIRVTKEMQEHGLDDTFFHENFSDYSNSNKNN